jgi:transcriptional regulator with XRE-family HTH domain
VTFKMPLELREAIAQNIKGWRIAREMTQPQLSQEAGVGLSTIQALESGSRGPSLEAAVRIVGALSISLDQLIESEDDE